MTDTAILNETTPAERTGWARTAAPWAFGGAMLLSAALVFSLQPMFAKMVLPRVGGGAAVWTVALVFFQGALLAGYSYAHFITSRFSFRRQIAIHACVLALAAFFLPIAVANGFDAPPESGQGLWLIALFSASVGAPFAAISATAPLLQAWFARTGRADANDPYYLYGASNAGSLAALLSFPLLIEPALGAQGQSVAWSAGFAVLGAAILGCAVLVWRTGAQMSAEAHAVEAGPSASWRLRGKWALLGLLPSALLVAATTHISTDVASAPLLWVIPLALYLSAFILAFHQRTWIPARVQAIALPALVAISLATTLSAGDWRLLSLAVLGALWMGAYVSCRALYDARPEARQLTDFYLWMSLGGVVGGALTALLAPMVFDSVLEWPLALAASLLALPGGQRLSRPMWIIYGACLAITLVAALVAAFGFPAGLLIPIGLATGLSAILIGRSRALMAFACAALILMGAVMQHRDVVFADRSFYGAVRVMDDGPWRRFVHGTTMHGVQSLDPALAHTPTGYYGPLTPIGSAIMALNEAGRADRVAVLGLGAGATACYARAGQHWTYYEIDPLVVQVAQDRRFFTFLSDCAPDAQIVVGDARLELARQPQGAYDLVLADVFSSDAVPTHLITREAMQLYLDRVDEDGVVLIHVSNRNLAMADVAARAALAAGAVVVQRLYLTETRSYANFSSEVIAFAKTREALAPLLADPSWRVSAPPPGRAWTDDYSNILDPLVQRIAHPIEAH
jgi:hypothetical protein